MRIALVNSHDVGGGAAGFTRHLAAGLLERGHEVALVVGTKKSELPWVHEVPVRGGGGWVQRWLETVAGHCAPGRPQGARARYLARRLIQCANLRGLAARRRGFEDFDLPGSGSIFDRLPFTPDVIHLNNLHYLVGPTNFDLRLLPRLGRRWPLVYTLHDTWSFTGHCVYFFGCERWKHGCGQCPHAEVYAPLPRDQSAANRALKASVYQQTRFTLTTPSRWLMNCARESILVPALEDTRVIPYGIDLEFFRPAEDRGAVRASLGLGVEEPTLCFVADGGRKTPWRDFDFVASVARAYRAEHPRESLTVIEVGSTAREETIDGVRFLGTGRLDADGVRRVFQASDLMMYPAKADNFPYVILESLACGTPVLATRVGGVPEQVVEGESGMILEPGDLVGATRSVRRVLSDPALHARMRESARSQATRAYAIERMVGDYEAVYERMLTARRGGGESEEKR